MTKAELDAQKKNLVVANRILVAHHVLDAYGHVSVRSCLDESCFLLSRNLAPNRVTTSDVQKVTMSGGTSDPRPGYLERFIHSEIYKARPDVMSIVHSHAPVVLPFTVADTPLRAVSHMAGFLRRDVPVFEIRNVAGHNSDLLITNSDLGRALAECLGDASVCLMRGHGLVVVGTSLAQAVHRSVFTLLNASTQRGAIALGGEVAYLTEGEAASAAASNDTQVHRAWELWKSEIQL